MIARVQVRRGAWTGIFCLLATASCAGGAALDAAKRDIDLASAKRGLALSESPNRQERLGFELNLKEARKSFTAGQYEKASEFAVIARQAAEDAYAARLRKRDEVLRQVASVRKQVDDLKRDNDPRLELAKLLQEVAKRDEEAGRAFASKDYDAALTAVGEASLILEKRFSLFLQPTPGGSSESEQGRPDASVRPSNQGRKGPGERVDAAKGRTDLAEPGLWDRVKAFVTGEPGTLLAPAPDDR